MRLLKEPRADKAQQRHLLARVDQKHESLERDLCRREGRNFYGNATDDNAPPDVKAARALVEAWENEQELIWEKKKSGLSRLRSWLREQALFVPAREALHLLKTYESLDLEQAMTSALTMEDRNDAPLGLPH